MRFIPKRVKNSVALVISMVAMLLLLLGIWARLGWPAGGMDSWNHYLYCRWALTHPELIWDQWGKTLFTLPGIPFAYFGIQGLYVFNIICCLVGAFFTYKAAHKLDMRYPWMAILFYVLQPVVFANTISALTEPLNAMVLAIIFYLLADKRWAWAAVITSFLPFFRTEGWVLLLGISFYYIARSLWKRMPILAVGSISFAALGQFVFGNWLWFISNNPYVQENTSGRDWGHGSWTHFIDSQKGIWGTPMFFLMILALVILLVYTFRLIKKHTLEEKSVYAYWLITPVFLGFFMAHTIIWVFGMFGSNGLTRVFYIVAPCTALLATYALHKITFIEINNYRRVLTAIVIVLLLYTAYGGSDIPMPWKNESSIKANPLDETMYKAMDYIKKSEYKDYHMGHQLPVLNVITDTDPWAARDQAKFTYLWSIDTIASNDFTPKNTIIIWDGWHATREGGKPKDVMLRMKQYQKIKEFKHSKDSIHDVILFVKTNE